MQILNSLVPIFSVIALGMVLRSQAFLTADTTQAFNRFAYFFALPLFLFYKLASASSGSGSANLILNTLLSAAVLTAIVSWLATWILKLKPYERGTTIQASFRGNLAFIGLPLVLFTIYDLPADQKMTIESAVLLALAPVVLFYNVGSVVALAIYNQNTESNLSFARLTGAIAKNPLIWACIGGALFQYIGWKLPTAVVRTCEVVGASAFPMALLGIGSQLISISVKGSWSRALLPTIIKCIVCPLLGWILGRLLGLTGIELQVTVILCAAPTAVSSYVLAEQMDGDADLAASSVVICTAFSLLTLSLLLSLTGTS
jgi:predicted permease